MLKLTVKDNTVDIEAVGVNEQLLSEAAHGVGSLIGQIASCAPDSMDKERLMKIMGIRFISKFTDVMEDRYNHKGGSH